MLRKLINDDFGGVLSIEFIFMVTILSCGAVVGLTAVRDAVVNELNDISHAVGAVSQTYYVTGVQKDKWSGKPHASCSSFGYNDHIDECDCKIIRYTDMCGKDDPSAGKDE